MTEFTGVNGKADDGLRSVNGGGRRKVKRRSWTRWRSWSQLDVGDCRIFLWFSRSARGSVYGWLANIILVSSKNQTLDSHLTQIGNCSTCKQKKMQKSHPIWATSKRVDSWPVSKRDALVTFLKGESLCSRHVSACTKTQRICCWGGSFPAVTCVSCHSCLIWAMLKTWSINLD